jgi:hypothetical protein
MVCPGVALILCYVMLCCLILCAKSDALNEQNLMLCYAVLWFVMLTYFMSKILCSQWVKSCDLLSWEIMIEIFLSKTLCTVMNCSNGQNLIALNSVMSNDYTLLIADVCKRWAPLKCTICHALNCSLQIGNANK